MPASQQKKVGVSIHDRENFDVHVNVSVGYRTWTRYSVIVPKAATREQFLAVAVDLAILVRALHHDADIVVPGGLFQSAGNLERWTRQIDANQRVQQADRRHDWYSQPEPSAEQRASALLASIDPDLWRKVSAGKAFFFTTANHRYIVYPNQRALIDINGDEPKYMCVHSKDHAVELNKYDWALTMRTYLLGDEEHLRRTTNFHSEYGMRAPADAHQQDDETNHADR